MELIIDVDEKLVCEGFERPFTEEERDTLIRAIGNAKSYNPSDDCISREALRKALDELFKSGGYDSGLVMDAIDNAPAVQQNWRFYYDHGYAQAKRDFGRPKGEWVDLMKTKGYVVCPFCGKEITGGDLNFCVKCGADLRKGGAENG